MKTAARGNPAAAAAIREEIGLSKVAYYVRLNALLDEPAAGVPEAERRELMATVAGLPDDVSVLLIEHDMGVVMDISDRVVVLDYGRKIGDGRPDLAGAHGHGEVPRGDEDARADRLLGDEEA